MNIFLKILYDGDTIDKQIDIIDQEGYGSYIQAKWIILNDGREVFLTLQRGDPLKYFGNQIIGVHLVMEQYVFNYALVFSNFIFILILFIQPLKRVSKFNNKS